MKYVLNGMGLLKISLENAKNKVNQSSFFIHNINNHTITHLMVMVTQSTLHRSLHFIVKKVVC